VRWDWAVSIDRDGGENKKETSEVEMVVRTRRRQVSRDGGENKKETSELRWW
jgi:hypothetical protein